MSGGHVYAARVEGLLAALVIGAPLAIGSVHSTSAVVGACTSLLIFLLVALWSGALGRRMHVDLVGGGLLLAAGVTLFQVIPLPRALLSLISPELTSLRAHVLGAAAPSWATLSVSPQATWLELAKWSGYGALYLAVRNAARFGLSPGRAVRWLAISGGLIAGLGIVQMALDLESVLGLYTPRSGWGTDRLHGTFVNSNHAAGLLGLCALVCAGWWGSARSTGIGLLLGTLALLQVAAVGLTLSRGGVVALIAAGVLFFYLLQRRASVAGWARSGALALSLFVFGVAAWIYRPLVEEFAGLDGREALLSDMKFRSWPAAWRLAMDHPWFGVGRGAFELAYPRYKELDLAVRFTHPENLMLQAASEWGLPLTLALGLVIIVAMVRPLWRWKLSALDAGILSGLAFLLLHNMVDFNLEYGGVATPAVVALASLGRIRPRRARARSSSFWPRNRVGILLSIGLSLCMSLSMFQVLRQDGGVLTPLRSMLRGGSVHPTSFIGASEQALVSSPMDYRVPRAAAGVLLRSPGVPAEQIVYWLNRALFLNPTDAESHWLTAKLLWRAGRVDQALLEYRLAARYSPRHRMKILEELDSLGAGFEALRNVISEEPSGFDVLGQFYWRSRRVEPATRAYRELLEVGDTDQVLEARRWLGRLSLRAGALVDAQRFAEELLAKAPRDLAALGVLGEVHRRAGRFEQAVEAYQTLVRRKPNDLLLHIHFVESLLSLKRLEEASRALRRLRVVLFSRAPEREGTYYHLKGVLLELRGHFQAALVAYRQSVTANPEVPRYRFAWARLLETTGDLSMAQRAYRQGLAGLKAGRQRPDIVARLEALEARLQAAPAHSVSPALVGGAP